MGLRLTGEVALDGSGFEAGLNRVEKAGMHAFGRLKEAAVAAFGVYGIEEAIRKTVEFADKMADTATRLGIGVEALQELGFAAKQSGSDLEALTGFIEKLNTARIDPKKLGSFGKFGISQSDLQSLAAEDLIGKISQSVRGRNPQEFIGSLKDVGGKGAGNLIPMLKEDIDAVREAARNAGAVMRTEQIASMKVAIDQIHLLSQVILAQLAPAVVFLAETFAMLTRRAQDAGSFWGDVTTNLGQIDKKGWMEVLKNTINPLNWFKDDPFERAFAQAGARSAARLQEGDDDFENRIAALAKALSNPQHPDFESVMPEPKEKRAARAKEASDSLIKVGNFLGQSRDPISSIEVQQLEMLRKIEYNTRPKPSSADSTEFPNN